MELATRVYLVLVLHTSILRTKTRQISCITTSGCDIKSKQVLQCRIFALGASLAQDRGRLEAKIEVLTTELESQKKQNQRDNDSLKIKTKIVDDQTETIRKLKEVNIHF